MRSFIKLILIIFVVIVVIGLINDTLSGCNQSSERKSESSDLTNNKPRQDSGYRVALIDSTDGAAVASEPNPVKEMTDDGLLLISSVDNFIQNNKDEKFYTAIGCETQVSKIESFASKIKSAVENMDNHPSEKANILKAKSKFVSFQKKEFARLRKEYGKLLDEALWEMDGDAIVSGPNNSHLTLIAS